jgi:uncharacterized protein YmfQ (DUF2313 family)
MPSVAVQTDILASYLPPGKAFMAKKLPESNLYKFLKACALSYIVMDDNIQGLFLELDPTTTEDLISEWEQEFGIPDACLDVETTLEERRANVLAKITMDGVTTVEDFERLADVYDMPIVVTPGFDETALPFVLGQSVLGGSVSLFTMFVDFPKEFSINKLPFTLGLDKLGTFNSNVVECLFNRVKPVNVQALYRYIL